jgi:hypothetical protein
MKNTEWVFLGIGGTSSWPYHTCWTYELYKQFSGKRENSRYMHGPDDSGLGTGKFRNSAEKGIHFDIVNGPESELGRAVNEIVKDATIWLKQKISEARRSNKTIKIALVGHSRGGWAVIEVAKSIQLFDPEVCIEFMGLFDAVKRTFVDEIPLLAMTLSLRFLGHHRLAKKVIATHEQIPPNVKLVYHALRSWESRTWFGNTGTTLSNSGKTKYYEKKFNTSHGGVGGSAAIKHVKRVGLSEDTSDYNVVYRSGHHPIHGAVLGVDHYAPKWERISESMSVIIWMKHAVFLSGVPISGIQLDQRPLRSNDAGNMWV